MDLDELDDLDPVEVVDESTQPRDYGIIVFGATGYTGSLIVEHLDALLAAREKPMQWGIAGRDLMKLRRIARKCKTTPAVLLAKTPAQIASIVGQARAVVNASGPYIHTGEDIVMQCVNQVTHYVDVSGEIVFIANMIKKYHQKAMERGVLIVHAAGSVCAPDELICYSLVQKLGPLRQFREYFLQYGAMSGGTFNTNLATMESLTQDDFDVMTHPFCLGGMREGCVREGDGDCAKVRPDPLFPSVFLMPAYNERVGQRIIRRSCQLFEDNPHLGPQYGETFSCCIRDCHLSKGAAEQGLQQNGPLPSLEAAKAAVAAMKMSREAGQTARPGEGAPAKTRSIYSAEVYGLAEGESGQWAHGRYTAGDAYEATAMAAVAGALVMVEELDKLNPKERGGVLTPAFAWHGSTWIERLTSVPFACNPDNCKISFEITEGQLAEEQLVAAVKAKTKKIAAGQSQIMKGALKSWDTPAIAL